MKKFVVLMLVFAMASLAGATVLELSVDGVINGPGETASIELVACQTVTIDVYCSTHDGANYLDFWLGIEGDNPETGEWYRETAAVYAEAPENFEIGDGGYGALWFKSTVTDPTTDVGEVGKWFQVVFHCKGEGELDINLYDPTGYTVVDTVHVSQVPEPATMLILGLGTLLLRRKK